MTNHFHLVVETPRPNLSIGMQWLLGRYTQEFNRRHRLCGHLFAGRYKALLVDGREEGQYLRRVCDYVHLNPARAGMLRDSKPLESYPWSSYPYYLKAPGKRPSWMQTDRLFGEYGLSDRPRDRREFGRRMEARRNDANGPWEELKAIRSGWRFGAEDFLDWILERVEVKAEEEHPGPPRDETEEGKALRIIRDEMELLGWTATDLHRRRKGDPTKIAIARRLRKETAVTAKWIAEALSMGSSDYVRNRLYHYPE